MAFHSALAEFAVSLFRALPDPEKEVVFSPLSIAVALGMCYGGAAGNTADQFKKVLFEGVEGDAEIHGGFKQVMEFLNGARGGEVKLNAANRIYVQESYAILQAFEELLKRDYQSELQRVDFVKNKEAVVKGINGWVAEQTNDKITNLISPDNITDLTRLILVNAIYFKGNWTDQFLEANTTNKPFYVNKDKSVKVKMMWKRASFLYGEDADLDVEVLGIPFVGKQLYFYILLPTYRDGLADLEAKLTGENLLMALRRTKIEDVILGLPTFKMECGFSLVDALKQLGLTDMFDMGSANFTLVSKEKPPLLVSEVLHKAFVEVNEKGTEAAAATAIDVPEEAAAPMPKREPLKFVCDHGLLFAIADEAVEKLLFLGRFAQPTQDNPEHQPNAAIKEHTDITGKMYYV